MIGLSVADHENDICLIVAYCSHKSNPHCIGYTEDMPSIHAIYASTSGHTEYVVDVVRQALTRSKEIAVTSQRAELAQREDLARGDVLLLASGTWNTDGIEGQLNEHMHRFLFEQCKDVDLQSKPVVLVSLGDERYYFTTRCTEHFQRFVRQANGKMLTPPLIIVNEPYTQHERIEHWAARLASALKITMKTV